MNNRIPIQQEFSRIAANVYFVLIEPQSPGNVGATARAMKTCGFYNLILVNPQLDMGQPEVFWMAHQSADILRDAQIFSSFSEAIRDKSLVIATTQRKRHFKFPFFTPQEVAHKVEETAIQHPVAIVFGRERTGLTNSELLECHIHSTIQTATVKPSLNLAQAVMIYTYTFFNIQNVKGRKYRYDPASQYELDVLYEHLQNSLKSTGFVPRDSMDNFLTRFKRLIGRSMAEKRDVRLLHKILQIYEKKIDLLQQSKGGGDESEENHRLY